MIVADLLRTCCGPCVQSREINTLTKVSEITPAIMAHSHFVFPVLGRPDTEMLYNYRFIPLIETPNVHYITTKHDHLMQVSPMCNNSSIKNYIQTHSLTRVY